MNKFFLGFQKLHHRTSILASYFYHKMNFNVLSDSHKYYFMQEVADIEDYN